MPDFSTKLSQLITKNRVMTLSELRENLNQRSQASIFRDLNILEYYSSYTQAGKYYTLKNIPHFNQDGLWFYDDIGFSKHGNLKQTIVQLIENSPAGKTQTELQQQLRVRTHNTLLNLFKENKISRHQLDNIYIYVSIDEEIAKQQLEKRESTASPKQSVIELPSEMTRIDIFVEIINDSGIEIDPAIIKKRLKQRGIHITSDEIESVIVYYGLKKNWI